MGVSVNKDGEIELTREHHVLELELIPEVEWKTVTLDIPSRWKAPMPTLEDSTPKRPKAPQLKCKHPSSFLQWEDEGRRCRKCDKIIAKPR